MKLIQVTDLQNFVFNINPNQITRVEEYSKSNTIVIHFSDGFGLKSNISLAQLLFLIGN
jgi:hypothetical protein